MKKIVEEIFIRGLGLMFGLGVSFLGLILLVFGIAFCTSAIGIIVGIPLIVYGFSLIIGGVISGFKTIVNGKSDFKFKKCEAVPEFGLNDLRWKYTEFKMDERYINN